MVSTLSPAWYTRHVKRVMTRYPSDIGRYRGALSVLVKPGDRLLHIGCGWDRSAVVQPYIGRCHVVGVDLVTRGAEGYPGEFWRADAARLPFGALTFDLACSEYVLEHLADPDACFAEVSRVLRPGGQFVFLTPNRWSYKSLVAAVTPHWFHRFAAARLRPDSRGAGDVFRTLYRANTTKVIERLAATHGFVVETLEFLNNGPTWFRRTPGLFEIGDLYHRAVGSSRLLNPLRCAILASLRQSGQGTRHTDLALRCTRCGAEGMQSGPHGYTCGRCHRIYRRTGKIIDTVAD